VKVCILGNSGSGKSYLAKKIGCSYPNVALAFLDYIYFCPERNETGSLVRRSEVEKSQLIESIKSNESWIAEGVFGELVEKFLYPTDHVILLFLDIEWEICQQRIVQRPNNFEGVIDSQESLSKLLKFGAAYFTRTDKRSCHGHLEIFNLFQGPKLRITSEEECNKLLQLLDTTKDLMNALLVIGTSNSKNLIAEQNTSLKSNDLLTLNSFKFDRTTYTKNGYRKMRPEQFEQLLSVEKELGRSLDEIDELSLGCVVVHLDVAGPQLLLLSNGGYFALPKGHKEIGEEEIVGAIRETNEETGTSLTANNIVVGPDGQPFQVSKGYSFVGKLHKDLWQRHANYPNESLRPFMINHKMVRYFLAVVEDRSLMATVGEDSQNKPAWYPAVEAMELLTFDEDKQTVISLLTKANISVKF